MGSLIITLVDSVLFVLFLVIAAAAPLHDGQVFFPELYPAPLVEFKEWYTKQYGDYLFAEEPHFFVGLVLVELVFLWPLAVASLYGIAARKPWINTTCFMFGASFFTSMAAFLGELILSKRATSQLLTIYFTFSGLAVLALLRGFFGPSHKTAVSGKSKREKKRA